MDSGQMEVLFLDDCPYRRAAFRSRMPSAKIVVTAAECIEQLKLQAWDEVHLDHDLGGEAYVNSGREDCGMEVVRWLLLNTPDLLPIVHSHNEQAAPEMVRLLQEAGYLYAKWIPFRMNHWVT